MYFVSPKQCKAARVLLDWSGEDLAKFAGLSVTTIRNYETGDSTLAATNNIIRTVMENKGIEFLDGDGVKLRDETVRIYRGHDCSGFLIEDILQTAKEKSGEICALFHSVHAMNRMFGVRDGKIGLFEPVRQHATIKCLVPEAFDTALLSESFQLRTIMKQHIGSRSYVLYGRKYAIVEHRTDGSFVFLIFDWASETLEHRKHFNALWEMAPPVLAQFNAYANRVAI